MNKVAIIFWSGTGNTEKMADKVAEGAKSSGAEVDNFTASEFSSDKIDNYDAFAFGCPSMGSEVLEESEFEPMFSECEAKLKGKKLALFGSYGWGGQSVKQVHEALESCGFTMLEPVSFKYIPDEEFLKTLREKVLAAI